MNLIINMALWGLQLVLLLSQFETEKLLTGLMILIGSAVIEGCRIYFNKFINTSLKEISLLEGQREQMNETFQIVRQERHDFLKHVSAMQIMLENNQFEETKDYFHTLVQDYEKTNLSIKGERGATAGILHQMRHKGEKTGVNVIYDFEQPLSSMPVPDTDMVKLIGNLLSNAIDASIEWSKEKQQPAFLTLQFQKRAGLYILTCTNQSLPIPTDVLDNLYVKSGITTKSGAHEGLGTKIIKETVALHSGHLDFTYKNEEFTVKIKVPAIR
ncbi:sensor histidine kinase [Jeotgalibacillus sp. R-1-5s-1]|uniref:sensor histidine kinase n=1 Tax=Jeotgalibacillus sp. R-1-5s-1 TaxID=2555897 RepID=UPI00141AAC04|nr:GHKL domain-containing protein [Jeotgalibacillus sp. R-1-5s-1]